MELHFSETDSGIRMIRLTGKLDIVGVRQIEAEFAEYCSGDGVRVIVDLAGVDFLTSIGIRMLLLTSKSMASRGGKMVLLNRGSWCARNCSDGGNRPDLPGFRQCAQGAAGRVLKVQVRTGGPQAGRDRKGQ
jgi:anti-anti-sigma factor